MTAQELMDKVNATSGTKITLEDAKTFLAATEKQERGEELTAEELSLIAGGAYYYMHTCTCGWKTGSRDQNSRQAALHAQQNGSGHKITSTALEIQKQNL